MRGYRPKPTLEAVIKDNLFDIILNKNIEAYRSTVKKLYGGKTL